MKRKLLLICWLSLFTAFKASAAAPVITSFSPSNGPVGTSVTITGTGFNTTAANNVVFFGATQAAVTAASATTLTVTVPIGSGYNYINVLNTTTLLSANSLKQFNTTFAGKGAITFADISPAVAFVAYSPRQLAVSDFDGDGKADVALLSNSYVSLFKNTATSGSISASSFAAKVDITPNGNGVSIVAGDVDNDGKPDLIVSYNSGTAISVFRNTSTPGTISFATKVDYTINAAASTVRIADIDGDGKPEIICVNTNGNTLLILPNKSTSGTIDATSFGSIVTLNAGSGCYGLAIGDIDGDGKPDLVTSNSTVGVSTLSIFQNLYNTGAITPSSFGTRVDLATPTSSAPNSVVLGDFDGDGRLDIADANNTVASVSLFRNNITTPGTITSLSFDTRLDVPSTNTPRDLTVGDIDGDGKPDLLVTTTFGTTVQALKNSSVSGSISFAAQVGFTTGTRPQAVSLYDIDGDGKLDLVVGNSFDNNFTVSRNNPLNPSSNIVFSNTNGTSTTATWTSGNAASRAVFVLAGTAGTPTPVNNTTYTGNAAFKSGTQIGSSGWYCVYNGSGNSVTVTGLTSGTTYRFITLEYNGSAGSELYLTTTATNNPNNVTPATPAIASTGSLSALTTTYGTPSSSGTFNVSGANISGGILVTPPTGFEVSADNVTFSSTVTIGTTGTIASTPVYVRLASNTLPGSYSGNIVLTSFSATNVNLATVSSTVNQAPLTITANNVTKTFGATLTNSSSSTAFTSSGLKNSETIGTVIITYGAGAAAADPVNTYIGSVVASAASGGTFTSANYTITYVPGNISVIAPVTPIISSTGTLSALSTAYGTSSAPVTFNVSGTNLNGGILITAPTGFEVSANNINFFNSITIGSAGNVASTPVYVRLSSVSPAGTYTGNIVLTSPSAPNVNVPTVTSTITPAPLSITANNVSKVYGTSLTGVTGSTAFTVTGLKNGETVASVNISYGTGSSSTAAANTYNAVVTPALVTGGTFLAGNYNITYVAGNITVTPAVLTITANSVTKNYGAVLIGAAGSSAFTSAGLQNGETVGSVTIAYGAGSSAAAIVGVYTGSVTPSAAIGGSFLAGNYTINYVSGNITVNAVLPSALTIAATAISSTTATLSGTVNDNGSATTVTIQYSTSPTLAGATIAILTTGTSPQVAGTGNVSFSSNVTGLTPGTTYYYNISASNTTGTTNGSILSFNTLNTNATLSNIVVNGASISPSFSSGTYFYTASVANNVTSITVTPTLSDNKGTVTVNGSNVSSGSPSAAITLNIGDNPIQVIGTAQDGITKYYYTVTVRREIAPEALVATNILSPNGDGVNDTWVIKYISLYPNNTVTVYDRSGRVVYTKKGYNNDWDGSYNGAKLSEDTYYYVVSLGDNLRTFKGYITILRKR